MTGNDTNGGYSHERKIALEAEVSRLHAENARLKAVISRLRRRAERERTRYLPAGDILDLLAQMETDDE